MNARPTAPSGGRSSLSTTSTAPGGISRAGLDSRPEPPKFRADPELPASPPVVVLRRVGLLQRGDLVVGEVERPGPRRRPAGGSAWWRPRSGRTPPAWTAPRPGRPEPSERRGPRRSCWIASTTGLSTSRSNALATASADDRAVCSPQGRAARPLASGEYGVRPTPWSRHIGIMSRSSSRLSTLYWSCIAENVVQPLTTAACCIFANCQAHIDDAPR